MKKLSMWLLVVCSMQQGALAVNEVKIYRYKVHKLEFIGIAALGTASGVASAALTGMYLYHIKRSQQSILTPYNLMVLSFLSGMGLLATGGLTVLFNFLRKWNSLIDKPKLILDEEGFTYEKWTGLLSEPQDVRYLWKDVIKQWDNVVVNQYNGVIRREWCYYIQGEKDIVKINVSELDIPDDIKAKVEAIRIGGYKPK